MKKKRGQAGTEYVILAALVFFTLTVGISLLYNYSKQSFDEMAVGQMQNICWDIIAAAESVYYQGYPARQTIETNFPNGLTNATLAKSDPLSGCTKCTELRFTYGSAKGKPEIVCSTSIPLNASFTKASWSTGKKHIRLISQADYVDLNITG